MNQIADFTENEMWIINTTLGERYGSTLTIETQMADSEIRLHSSDRELTLCPVVFWQVGQCHFVLMKTDEKRYRCQFYYRIHQQFSTGIPEYDDLTECVVTLLQAQADHDRELQQNA